MKTTAKLWVGMGILILLTPLGLLLPEYFKSGDAWGEWGADTLKELVGYVPQGLEKLSRLWSAPMPDYAFGGSQMSGAYHFSIAYILSAIIGVAVIAAAIVIIGKFMIKRGD